MASNRIETAFIEGVLSLPDGPVWLLRPTAGFRWPGAATHVTHGFRPEFDWWAATGAEMEAPARPSVAVVCVPRSKSLARSLVADAARATLVIVDGQKTDGVDSLFQAVRREGADVGTLTKAHGRLFWFTVDAELRTKLAAWHPGAPTMAKDGFYRQPGVFSETSIDKGSAVLADALPEVLPRRVVDLGAGWGYLSAACLRRTGVEELHLVEAEALSLECARLNISDPRAQFHWADATRFSLNGPVDAVVANPPFHQSRKGEPALGQAFIETAARLLTPKGSLWMVANRHLPYEQALDACFREVAEKPGASGFKVFRCSRPNSQAAQQSSRLRP